VGNPRDLEVEVELLSTDAVNVKRGADVSIGRWRGDVPLRGKVVLVEPGAFLKVSALGVEEQRVKVRVSLIDLPENVLGIATELKLALPRGPVKMLFGSRALHCFVAAKTG